MYMYIRKRELCVGSDSSIICPWVRECERQDSCLIAAVRVAVGVAVCVAVCGANVLQMFVTYSVLFSSQHTATHCNTLQHTDSAMQKRYCRHRRVTWPVHHCNTLQHNATHCNTHHFKRDKVAGDVWRDSYTTATHCNTLPRTATHCDRPIYSELRLDRSVYLRAAPCCHTLQYTVTHCNTLQLR